jgi:translocator protein
MAALAGLAVIFGLVQLVASIFLLIDAFQKSVGKGFMVLCIPCYIIYYMFSEFDHPRKNQILAAWWVGAIGSVILNVAARGSSMMQ